MIYARPKQHLDNGVKSTSASQPPRCVFCLLTSGNGLAEVPMTNAAKSSSNANPQKLLKKT